MPRLQPTWSDAMKDLASLDVLHQCERIGVGGKRHGRVLLE
jgi:hypothetical protein